MVIELGNIKEISKGIGVSEDSLKQHVNALKLCQVIQNYENRFILYGGTAVQFYIDTQYQRTSVDVDLITTLSLIDIKASMDMFTIQNNNLTHDGGKPMGANGIRYKFEAKNVCQEKECSCPRIKIEIVSREEEMPPTQLTNDGCKLFGRDCGRFILLPKEDLFAKKIVALDLDGLGVPRNNPDRTASTETAKHVYDLKRLYDSFQEPEFAKIGETIYKQFQNEIIRCGRNSTPDNHINNVCNVLISLGNLEIEKNNGDISMFNRGYKTLKSLIPENARILMFNWGAIGWDFEHLLRCVKLDHEDGNSKKALAHHATREENRVDGETSRIRKNEMIKILLGRGVKRPFKNRPLPSLIFKKESMDGIQ